MQGDCSGSGRRSMLRTIRLLAGTTRKSRFAGSHDGLMKRLKGAKLQHRLEVDRNPEVWPSMGSTDLQAGRAAKPSQAINMGARPAGARLPSAPEIGSCSAVRSVHGRPALKCLRRPPPACVGSTAALSSGGTAIALSLAHGVWAAPRC